MNQSEDTSRRDLNRERPAIAGVILAAGASRRMGSPKPLLDAHGRNFLNVLIAVMGVACRPMVVVLGHGACAVQRSAASTGAQFVINPHPERGQLSSLQCGIAACPEEAGAVMFCPVDYPAVQADTVRALAAAFESGDSMVAVPRFDGRHGHPVLIRRSVAEEILALPASATARDVIHRHASQTRYVDVPDGGILVDVDTPAEYRALTESLRRP